MTDALLAYRRVGVDTVLIRGFDPLDDVIDWGKELVPLLREQAVSRSGSGPRLCRHERPGLDLGGLPEVTAALGKYAEENDRTGAFPAAGIEAVHAAGLLTATVAERYGGPGAGLAQTAEILYGLGRGDPSVALITAMTLLQHAAQARQETWPAELYAETVAESKTTPVLINALRVEPELGTPARGGLPATTARPVPGGWSLTGHKIFSTGAAGCAGWSSGPAPTSRARGSAASSCAPTHRASPSSRPGTTWACGPAGAMT